VKSNRGGGPTGGRADRARCRAEQDESHIVIGGIPLDIYDAQIRRQMLRCEALRVGRLLRCFVGVVVVLGLLCGILATGGVR